MPMIRSAKKNTVDFIGSVTRKSTVVSIGDKKEGLEFLISFFSAIRPSRGRKNAVRNLESVISELYQHPILLTNLRHALLSQLVNTDLATALSESGIPLAGGFWQEFFGRLRHKLLPPLQSENDFLYVVNRVFFRKDDYQWIEDIPHGQWTKFFEKIGLSFHIDDRRILIQLIQSVKLLGFQVAQLGLEKEVQSYLPESDEANNPFLEQHYTIHALEKALELEDPDLKVMELSNTLNDSLLHCIGSVNHIRQNHPTRGTSLQQTYTLVVLSNKLERMAIIADMLDGNQQFNMDNFISFFQLLVRNENRKNSIREFLSQCLGYLAYQIAEHKGSKGSAYITSTSGEYRKMFWSAMKGGWIISFIAIIKNLLTKLEMPIFWHGFTYSVNYSVGFLLIEESGATLATKQPAFTASALASSLDTKQQTYQPNLYNLALTVAKVSRSQIASFTGNLLVVFPAAYGLAWIYDLVTHHKIVEGAAALQLLENQHPWHGPALLYACNAGFFLFLSGIIAGYVQNKMQFSKISERLKRHPLLSVTFSPQKLEKWSAYTDKHAGAIVGNIALGFMLGMSAIVSGFFGIPFDIRHITISAGNVAIGVYGLGIENIKPGYLLTIFLGVCGIGLMNFIVSFSLAFIVAVKSRGVHLRDYPEFLGILWRYFKKRPLDFIRPRKQLRDGE
jgi:site-specific recombinase